MESLKALPSEPQNFSTHPGIHSSPCPTVLCYQASVLCSLSSRTATGTHMSAELLRWPGPLSHTANSSNQTNSCIRVLGSHPQGLAGSSDTDLPPHRSRTPHSTLTWGSGWRWVCVVFYPSSFEDNGMFSAGLSAHVLICVNLSSRLTKIFLWETKDKLAAQQHYQNPWDLSQSPSLAAAQDTTCTLKSEVFYCTFRVHRWTFHYLFPCVLDTEHRKCYLA